MPRHLLFPHLLALISVVFLAAACQAENWPGWRGPRGDGTSLETDVPLHWDGASNNNIAWRTRIPGRAHSSPIVWEDRIFVTSCQQNERHRMLICLDRRSGDIVWQETVLKAPLEKKHTFRSAGNRLIRG